MLGTREPCRRVRFLTSPSHVCLPRAAGLHSPSSDVGFQRHSGLEVGTVLHIWKLRFARLLMCATGAAWKTPAPRQPCSHMVTLVIFLSLGQILNTCSLKKGSSLQGTALHSSVHETLAGESPVGGAGQGSSHGGQEATGGRSQAERTPFEVPPQVSHLRTAHSAMNSSRVIWLVVILLCDPGAFQKPDTSEYRTL